MYEIIKNGAVISVEDKAGYVKMQSNGIPVLCSEDEAHGIVVDNKYICHLEGKPPIAGAETVTISEFNGAKRLDNVLAEGVRLAQASTEPPSATVGVLSSGIAEWAPGHTYEKQYSLFVYDGIVGFTRQPNITAQAVYPPFSPGTESIYGVRPVPDDLGIYPYIYNMRAEVGMLVRSAKDGAVYRAIQDADPLIWDPADVPAIFAKEEEA